MGKAATGRDDSRPAPIDWPALRQQVAVALGPDGIVRAYENLGVVFSGRGATLKGWKECFALGREDPQHSNPSAAVNVRTAYYTDRASDQPGGKKALHLFDFALEHGGSRFGRWIDAARHYAEAAGVPFGRPVAGRGGNVTEAIFEYRTTDGTVAYKTYRYRQPKGKKLFLPHVPDGHGGWRSFGGCMEGIQPLPYRLPDLLADPADEPLYVVEGEGKVDRLRKEGFPGTSAHGGCKAFDQTWAQFRPEWFAGRSCILLPDHSADGRAYMERVAGWLKGAGSVSVKVVDLPDLATDQDIIQWFDQGGTAEELAGLGREAKEWEAGERAEETDSETSTDGSPCDGLPPDDRVITICLADVKTEPIRWLWPDRIPIGMLTLIAGDQKVGKGFVTMDLAARVTTGSEIPGGQGECMPQGSVVLLTAEEGLSRIVRPRILAAEGDPWKLHELKAIKLEDGTVRPFDLGYLGYLERALVRFGDTRLLMIDPVAQYLPDGTDDHKSVQLRMVLGPLVEMAERLDVAIVLIHHLTKGNGTKGLYRVSGSGAYTQICRANWLVCKNPKDKTQRLFLNMGTNLVPDPTGLSFRIDRESMRIVWDSEPLSMSADDALRDERDEASSERRENQNPSKVEQCEAWLDQVFRPGRDIASDEILAEATGKGFSRGLVFAAKKRLPWIQARKDGFKGDWIWHADPQPSGEESGTPTRPNSSDTSDTSADPPF